MKILKNSTFDHIAEMKNITIANELDMSYDFYTKHNMNAVEWIINALINKNKSLVIKLKCNWRQPSKKKFESYRV